MSGLTQVFHVAWLLVPLWLTVTVGILFVDQAATLGRNHPLRWRWAARLGAIVTAVTVAAVELNLWLPGVVWLVALAVAACWGWRALRRRLDQPAPAQWTEDQLPPGSSTA